MKTQNARPPDGLESEWLADVKRVPCVTCDKPPPVEAHHPEQGLHFLTIAWCEECHRGPQGWHGDRSRMRVAGQNWLTCLNETHRRVVALRAGIPLHLLCEPKPIRLRPHGGDLSSDKILPRRY